MQPRDRHLHRALLIGLGLTLALGACVGQAPPTFTLDGRSLTVSDGDSLRVGEARYRLWGIDAPELAQRCRDEGGREYPCGQAAREHLARLIAGREVACTREDEDKYGRVVARCEVGGVDLGHAMVEAGHAFDYTRHSGGHYADAQTRAQAARAGIWRGGFSWPWRWRKDQREP